MLHALDASAARTQIAHDHSRVIFRRYNFDRHYRFKQYRRSFAGSFLESHRTGDLERHFVRIDVVIAAVVESGFDIDHLVSSQDATFHGLSNALIDRLNEFLRHGAADDIVYKFVTRTWRLRFKPNLGVAVLSAT